MKWVVALIVAMAVSPAFAARFAIVKPSGVVQTVVEADSAASVIAPPDHQVVPVPDGAPASSGATYSGGVFTAKQPLTSEIIERRLDAAIDANLAYLAQNPPTTAQSLAQVQALTRQVTAILRLMRNRLDSAD
jgi:hypothetical protein